MKNFITPNLYLSAAIVTLTGIQPEYKVQNNKTLFVFPVSEALYKAMTEYNNGAVGNLYDHDETIKRLRAEMLTRRNLKLNGGN